MKRIAVVYPLLSSYLLPVLQGIADSGGVLLDVLYSPPPPGTGFGEHLPFEHSNVKWIEVEERQPFGNTIGMSQKGIAKYLYTTQPDAILIWANPRYISFWGVLLVARLFGIPVYPRGHGLFKKTKVSLLHRIMYKVIVGLSKRYICYTPQVKESLLRISIPEEKLAVDYNSLYVSHPVPSEERTGDEKGILFIGRLRQLCGIELLIEAATIVHKNFDLDLHIIGEGIKSEYVQEIASQSIWINYHGMVYSEEKIREISRLCRFGCQPGYTGLSVVHLMGLSLPVIVHGDPHAQMGPEPEYILHGSNGYMYGNQGDVGSLARALEEMLNLSSKKMKLLQERSFHTYSKLNFPPYHERLLAILEGGAGEELPLHEVTSEEIINM